MVQQLASKEIMCTEKIDEVVVCLGEMWEFNFQDTPCYQKLLMNFEIMFLVLASIYAHNVNYDL